MLIVCSELMLGNTMGNRQLHRYYLYLLGIQTSYSTIERALIKVHKANILITASASNEGANAPITFPANLPIVICIKIIWIPGHAQIDRNERADAEAKIAAIHPPTSQSYNHRPLKSARTRTNKKTARKQWEKEWNENTKTAKALRRITKRKGVKTGPKLYNE